MRELEAALPGLADPELVADIAAIFFALPGRKPGDTYWRDGGWNLHMFVTQAIPDLVGAAEKDRETRAARARGAETERLAREASRFAERRKRELIASAATRYPLAAKAAGSPMLWASLATGAPDSMEAFAEMEVRLRGLEGADKALDDWAPFEKRVRATAMRAVRQEPSNGQRWGAGSTSTSARAV